MRGMRTTMGCAIAALLASGALAGEGVFEINAACAVEGCFAGDGPGFPVTLGNQAGRSFRLTGDLATNDPNTTLIRITANDVRLDLGGFRLFGPNACSGDPTSCTQPGLGDGITIGTAGIANVEVSGGSVTGFPRYGILLGRGSLVRSVRVSDNGETGILVGDASSVRDVIARQNGGDGIAAGTGSNIEGCVAAANRGTGINASTESRVSGSTADRNDANGIRVGNGGLASDNTSTRNDGDGISVGGGSLVIGNTIHANGGNGIAAGPDAPYRENVITENAGTVTSTALVVNLGANYCTDAGGSVVVCP